MIVTVRFIGGPFDGLSQGWNVTRALPEKLRMSLDLANLRGGIRMEVTEPSACGALTAKEKAPDEVLYRRRAIGIYYFNPIADDFELIPLATA